MSSSAIRTGTADSKIFKRLLKFACKTSTLRFGRQVAWHCLDANKATRIQEAAGCETLTTEKFTMSKLRLSMACWNYDRTRALFEDRIPIDGIDLNYINLPVEETFFRMIRHREFDVAEMSLSSYTLSLFREPKPFVAIPVFPSRSFRHSCIFINRNSGIHEPKDLIGKRVGNPEYQLTACVWIRGILSDEYGVPVSSVTYLRGGEEQPGRTEKIPLSLPASIRLESIPADKTL